MVLHELGHLTGIFGPDATDTEQSARNTMIVMRHSF
jgi:hypothetical protein